MQRKTKKFNRAFDQYQDYFFWFETQNKNTPHKKFYSHLLLLKQQTWKCKRKYILCQFWDTLAEYFWDIGSKVGSFVKYLLWHQSYFGTDYLPFLDLPPLCLTFLLICKFFNPSLSLFSILKTLYPPPPHL